MKKAVLKQPKAGKKVILHAKLEYSSRSKKAANLDFWYSSIYEIALNDIDLGNYSEMSDIFEKKVNFQPRTVYTSCKRRGCTKRYKAANCINDGEYCPIKPNQGL